MHIEYKIIWLDDNIDDFRNDQYINDIEGYLIEKGFNPIIELCKDPEGFFDKLDNTYDLILTDYHMSKMDGDGVIEKIRKENGVFTEILFYTARAYLKDTDKINRVSFLETSKSSYGHHKTVVDEVKKLIDLSLKKFNDIVVMRGMIISEVGNMDEIKLDIINKYINIQDTSKIKNEILQDLEKHFCEKKLTIKKWQKSENGFSSLIKDTYIFSSDYKIRAISYILNQLNQTDFTKSYKDEIIKMRNKFAHAKLIEEADRKYFKNSNYEIEFDDDYCRKIRKNIIKHQENLKKLQSLLEGLSQNNKRL